MQARIAKTSKYPSVRCGGLIIGPSWVDLPRWVEREAQLNPFLEIRTTTTTATVDGIAADTVKLNAAAPAVAKPIAPAPAVAKPIAPAPAVAKPIAPAPAAAKPVAKDVAK